MTDGKRRKLVQAAKDKKGVSTRKLASKFGVHHSYMYVSKVLKEEGLIFYVRRKAPAATPQQMEHQRTQCQKLSREFCPAKSTVKLVLDDESFFTLKNDELGGNRGFYTDNKENTSPGVKYKFKAKYEKKLLVWLAISKNGHSALYFCPSGCSINGDIYRNECISACLVPMINELHGDGDYHFWPDLAPAHYAHATIVLFQENNIKFMPKDANP